MLLAVKNDSNSLLLNVLALSLIKTFGKPLLDINRIKALMKAGDSNDGVSSKWIARLVALFLFFLYNRRNTR